jgi:hypothetical protein
MLPPPTPLKLYTVRIFSDLGDTEKQYKNIKWGKIKKNKIRIN